MSTLIYSSGMDLDTKAQHFIGLLDGKPVLATQLNRAKHSGIQFTCPYCEETLYPRIGDIRIKHFYHQKGGSCSGGGESELHYRMKYWFADQAEKNGFEVDVEIYIKDENIHKPDVLIHLPSELADKAQCKGIAIEFQNSPMTVHEYKERNETFLAQGYTPWWVFGGKNYSYLSRQLRSKTARIRSTELCVQDEMLQIFYLSNDEELITARYDGNQYKVNPVPFLDAVLYVLGFDFDDQNIPFEMYGTERHGFYVILQSKWRSIPQFLEHRHKILATKL